MSDASCCCKPGDTIPGCLVCGAGLIYSPDMALKAECWYCGQPAQTTVFCAEGHYVCDACHSKDILELVEQICADSDLTDPAELALCIFELPVLHMHGPEYHSIVPAVLMAAWGNSTGRKDTAAIQQAIKRGKAVAGGMCGTHGACGACLGVGIAWSLIHKVTPYSKEDRGEANRMTALALLEVSRHCGPRCCKRDAMTAIGTAKKHFGCYTDTKGAQYICSQHPRNDMCIKSACPYFPDNNE